MKKSEILKEIRDMIEEHKECCNGWSLANEILNIIKAAGIKPPHHPDRVGDEFKCRGNWSDSVYEWEEESKDCDIVD